MLTPSHSFFVDEAGHTGIDLVGLDQPVFVAGGFLVAESVRPQIEDLVVAALEEYRRATKHPHAELKASSMKGSARGRQLIAGLLRGVEAVGALPLVTAIEKRFSLGGRFVDDFFDLGDNPRAGSEYCLDRDVKRAAATAIGDSELSTLKAVETAFREPSTSSRRAAVEAVIVDLDRRGLQNLAFIAGGALLSDDALAPPDVSDLSFPQESSGYAPNPTALIALLVGADQYAKQQEIESVALVHDRTPHVEPALRHAYWAATDPGVHERMSNTPYLEWFPRVTRVLPPKFVASESEPLVQLADLLVGGMAHWIKRGMTGHKLDPSTRAIAEATLTIFLDDHIPGTGATLSDHLAWLRSVSAQIDPARLREHLGTH